MLLVDTDGQRRVVTACCAASAQMGITPGMPVAQARAVLPAERVRLEQARPQADATRLRALAVWARRFSPLVQPDEPDGLWLDITGCAHLFGGEDGMARAVAMGLDRLGFACRIAIADTHGCAWGIARFADAHATIVPPGEQRTALAPLPISALGVDARTVAALAELGIDRVEHLLDIPRKVLPARFGRELLLTLDSALGQAIEPISPVRPVAPCRSERAFDGYTTDMETIGLAVRGLLEDLGEQLVARGRGARRVVIELGRYELDSLPISVSLSVPSRDAKHLWTLVRPRLERSHLGFGVERITITATHDALIVPRQQHWHDNHIEQANPAELIDVLAGRLGERAVRGAQLAQSHLPERAFIWMSPMAKRRDDDTRPPGPRPPTLLEPPLPTNAIALTPDGPVHRIHWRGQDLNVLACVGPERIAGEWWRGPGSTRDYFRVRCEGGVCLWVARARETGRWYIHGVWA